MPNTIAKWISARLRALFFCGCCNPDASEPIPDPNIASWNSQDAPLINPFDMALETPKAPTSEKYGHSLSDGSAGDQSGMAGASQDPAARGILPNGTDQLPVHRANVLQPDTPSSEMDVQNRFTHQGTLEQHFQLVSGLREVDSTSSTVPPSIVEGGDEAVESQNPPVTQEVAAQFNVMGNQKLTVGRETSRSQVDTLPTQRDVADGSSQGQATDGNTSPPLSTLNTQNHSVLPDREPQGVMTQIRARWGETLIDADKVNGVQPSPFASEKSPGKNKEVDQPPQIFKERLPRRTTVMVGDSIVEDTQPSRVTNGRVREVEDDLPLQITKERPPRKRKAVEEEIVENAPLSRIRT